MLIDPWEVILGMVALCALLLWGLVTALRVAVRLGIWTYRGVAWTLARHQQRRGHA